MQRPAAVAALACVLTCLASTAGAATAPRHLERGGDHGILFARGSALRAHIYLWKPGRLLVRLPEGSEASDSPQWSPDGKLIAFTRLSGSIDRCFDCEPEVWVMRANGSDQRELTKPIPVDIWGTGEPSWSPSGRRIVFTGYEDGGPKLSLASVESGRVRPLHVTGHDPVWGPHGIAFAGRGGIRILRPKTGRSRLFRRNNTQSLAWSPDGGRLAAVPDVVARFPDTRPLPKQHILIYSYRGGKLANFVVPVPNKGVCGVSWSPDGTHLLLTVLPAKLRDAPKFPHLYEVDTAGRHWRRLHVSNPGCTTSWR